MNQGIRHYGRPALIILLFCGAAISFAGRPGASPQRYDIASGEMTIGPLRLALDLALGCGPAAENTFKYPYSVAVDDDGHIYVADRGNKRIQIFDTEGNFLTTIGGRRNNVVKLSNPKALAVDPAGRLFIGESGLRQPWLICLAKDLVLERTIKIPYGANQIGFLDGKIAIATKDRRSNANVYLAGPDGKTLATVDDIDPAEMLWRSRVNAVIDPAHGVILANEFMPRVRRYSENGQIAQAFDYQARPFNYEKPNSDGFLDSGENTLGKPLCYDVAVAPDGLIYLLVARDFAKNESCNLFQFDAAGKRTGITSLSFLCSRLVIDKKGNFYFLSQMETGFLYRYRPILAGRG